MPIGSSPSHDAIDADVVVADASSAQTRGDGEATYSS